MRIVGGGQYSLDEEQKGGDENADSSSSSNGRGSGTGYAADCSSSDSSSDSSSGKKRKAQHDTTVNDQEHHQLGHEIGGTNRVENGVNGNLTNAVSNIAMVVDDGRSSTGKNYLPNNNSNNNNSADQRAKSASHVSAKITRLDELVEEGKRMDEEPVQLPGNPGQLPQVNGVRVAHPMDPRIDLSAVGHIHTSPVPMMPFHLPTAGVSTSTTAVASVASTAAAAAAAAPSANVGATGNAGTPHPQNEQTVSIESYMHLMEVSKSRRFVD